MIERDRKKMRLAPMLVSENDCRVPELRRRMDGFYSSVNDYLDFAEANQKAEFWTPVQQAVEECLQRKDQCKVLEFGAGKTGFGTFLEDLRARITFHGQDVTPVNKDYLTAQTDKVFICDITGIDETYDVIFSTFTWEHISNPRQVLDHLLPRLSPGGVLILASPRYDFPFYLSPSARHLSPGGRLGIGLWLMMRRLKVACGGRADFLIHLTPACLAGPWFRDADAIHWVSALDIKRSLPPGFRLKRLSIGMKGWKGRLWERLALMFVQVERVD